MTTTNAPRRPQGWRPDLSTFGARLAVLRQAMGWGNVAEAATACGIPIGSWRNWERDGREPRSLVTASMKIAGVTGVDLDWLIRGPDVPAAVNLDRSGAATRRYVAGQRLVASIAAPWGQPDGRTVRAQPIEDRHLSLGHLSGLSIVRQIIG